MTVTTIPGASTVVDGELISTNPATGAEVARLPVAAAADVAAAVARARDAGAVVGRARLRRAPQAPAALAQRCWSTASTSWPS